MRTDHDFAAGSEPAVPASSNPHRWAALTFIALAQLMITLDITIVNIALPSLQADLGFSDGDRQWVITGYTLAFGSLLLLGGRIADYTGRKQTFLIALLGFAAASALGGAATSLELLVGARVLQGAFGALLAPAALSLLAVTFTEPGERNKAFGIYGAIAAGGGGIGLLTGGVLTDYLDWRWCFYVNIPIALITAIGAYTTLTESRTPSRPRFDLPGLVVVTAGLVAIVYGCSQAETDSWDSATVISLLVTGVILLAAFLAIEARVAQPLLPLRVLLDRGRGGAVLAISIIVIGMFGAFLLMTYYLQTVKGYSPIKTGVAFLPLVAGVMISGRGIATHLLPKVPPRALIAPGMLLAAAALAWFAAIDVNTEYAEGVMVSMIVLGLGVGLVMPVAMNYATQGVTASDSGVASATANTGMQVGGSIGTALLNTIATSATAAYLASHAPSPTLPATAMVEGFTEASAWAAGIIAVGSIAVAAVMNTPRPSHRTADGHAELHAVG
ncbi:MAG TPA: DHA2 family efflux MFS transporter permease subunit [Nocardioidaceae bacterium]|nr:DHA2 family efflux MFS transporter permease subunit [Nocardioidaceae bacterium]